MTSKYLVTPETTVEGDVGGGCLYEAFPMTMNVLLRVAQLCVCVCVIVMESAFFDSSFYFRCFPPIDNINILCILVV